MVENNLNSLFRLASAFRSGIVKCKSKSLSITLQDFPRGACGDAALLLAKYLENNGCGKFQYMLGQKNGYSHAWLQQDDIIVDITADQFHDQDSPVIVTRDDSWHSEFDGKIENVADFELYDQSTATMLKYKYREIVEEIT